MMSYRFGIVISVACMAFLLAAQGSLSKEKWITYTTPPAIAVAQVPVAPLLQFQSGKEVTGLQLTAQAALLIDQQSGSVLFEHNADAPLPPASTTKLMTALVAREVYAPGTLLRVPPLMSIGGTKVGLTPGLQYSVENILEAALISSGNDAAHTLAANMPGGVDAFVAQMNQKAQEIHLSTAAFINPTGFDAVQLRMSARDLSILTREVLKDSLLKAIVATPQTVISDISGSRKSILRTTNHLLGVDPRVVGVKTGTTEEAGQVLVSAFEIDDHVLISIVMGSADRYAETRAIVDWALDAYEWVEFDQTMVY